MKFGEKEIILICKVFKIQQYLKHFRANSCNTFDDLERVTCLNFITKILYLWYGQKIEILLPIRIQSRKIIKKLECISNNFQNQTISHHIMKQPCVTNKCQSSTLFCYKGQNGELKLRGILKYVITKITACLARKYYLTLDE